MRDETDEKNSGGGLGDLAILVAGCFVVFAGVFYFDRISTAISAQYKIVSEDIAAALKPTPAPAAKSNAATLRPDNSRRAAYLRADRYNQFFADAYINGTRISVLVDTGASHVSLRYEDARRLGIYLSDRDFTHSARTANGVTRVAPVMIDHIRIGEVEVRNIDGFVGEPGKNFSTLLGMTFLRKLSGMKISGRQMELMQ